MSNITRYSLAVLVLCSCIGIWFLQQGKLPFGPPPNNAYMILSPDAVWPWKGAVTKTIAGGVTQTTKKCADGTTLDLLEFDFGANPKLGFEVWDQDLNDAKPLDNRVLLKDALNVAELKRKFDTEKNGTVIAAWNGAFFGYDKKASDGTAFHVSPIIVDGKVLFNTAQHRWTFGVKNTPQGPVWKAIFKPSRAVMEREFDYGVGSLQCLIKDGKPLLVEPFPKVGEEFQEQPVPSNDKIAGHIPYFDHMRNCRSSMAWSRDNKHLYYLAVKDPEAEASSSLALSFTVRGEPTPPGTSLNGGWTVPDVQKFWESKKVWGAVNSDAGDVLQVAVNGAQGSFDWVPSRLNTTKVRVNVPLKEALPQGNGALMYFLVREKL